MHVGFSPVFMNTSGAMSDLECFKHELALADLAEPLGFDSIWQPEHHFSGYEMTPNVLQFLTYMAGRTKTVRLGSMVVVLPWHNPLRVVEDVTQLDYYSGGRAILGIGRGLGAMEFAGFGIEMSDTRDMFVEKAETVVSALKTGVIEYNGKYVKQPRRSHPSRAVQDVRGPYLWGRPVAGDDADFGEARRRSDDLPVQELAGHTRHAQYIQGELAAGASRHESTQAGAGELCFRP